MANGDPEPTTSSDKSPPDSPQPSTSGIQSGSGRPSNHELGYSLQPRRAYDAVKFGIKGTDYTIVLKNAGTRHYQQLVNEFTSIMNDIVDETLGNADPNDYVRFVLNNSFLLYILYLGVIKSQCCQNIPALTLASSINMFYC